MKLPWSEWILSMKHYLLMSVFLSGPDQLPRSPSVIPMTIAAYFLIGAFIVDSQRSFASIAGLIVTELIMLGGILYAGLRFVKKLPRFVQTYSALIGVNVVISSISLPVYRFFLRQDVETGAVSQSSLFLELMLIIWSLAVLTLIFKRSFGNSILLSGLLVFNYFVIYQLLIAQFL